MIIPKKPFSDSRFCGCGGKVRVYRTHRSEYVTMPDGHVNGTVTRYLACGRCGGTGKEIVNQDIYRTYYQIW
jgi:hypothetical protein